MDLSCCLAGVVGHVSAISRVGPGAINGFGGGEHDLDEQDDPSQCRMRSELVETIDETMHWQHEHQ